MPEEKPKNKVPAGEFDSIGSSAQYNSSNALAATGQVMLPPKEEKLEVNNMNDTINNQVMEVEGNNWAKTLGCHPERLPWDELNEQGLVGYKEMEII